MHSTQNIEDGEALAFGRGMASPSAQAPAAGSHIIPFQFQASHRRRPLEGLEDASSLDTFESLGELAVRIVGQFKLPRINVVLARE